MMLLCIDSINNLDWSISLPVIAVVISILGSTFLWSLNQKETRKFELYKRKEERYLSLLNNLKGFYENSNNSDLKNKFIDEFNNCWLYCPDSVIKKGREFLDSVSSDTQNKKDKQVILAEFVLEMRRDLMKFNQYEKTDLNIDDYKIYTANP
ncbi:MAG: hypothetical protein COA97_07180 [Flavobacteriales bacterium]|nr:MAG: hypothetical protein COA97_07180 [Flavobacteriales bacterium]